MKKNTSFLDIIIVSKSNPKAGNWVCNILIILKVRSMRDTDIIATIYLKSIAPSTIS